MMKLTIIILLFLAPSFTYANSIDRVKEKGYVSCGIYRDSDVLDVDTNGFEAILCKIFALALLSSENAVEISSLDGELRWAALYDNTVDILYAAPTWTMERDFEKKISFPAIFLFEAQLIVAKKDSGITSLENAPKNAKICTTADTSLIPITEKLINRYKDKGFSIVPINSVSGVKGAIFHDKCQMITEETSTLLDMFKDTAYADDLIILDNVVSIHPLSSVVLENEKELYRLSKWLMNGLIRAEQKGITKNNIDIILNKTTDNEIKYMLGKISGVGKGVGLDDKWLYRVIKSYGNYGEIFNKALGKNYNISRGNNNLINHGGLFFSYPFY